MSEHGDRKEDEMLTYEDVVDEAGEVPEVHEPARPAPATGLVPVGGVPTISDLLEVARRLQPAIGTGLVPAHIRTGAEMLAVMLRGRELGLGPMQSLDQLYVVNGRVALQASAMLGLIAASGKGGWQIEETTAERCTVTMWRTDAQVRHTLTFTLDDARRAGLADKQVWKSYPEAMLRARAISACARIVFPDVICGMYTPEELRHAVGAAETGEPLAPPPANHHETRPPEVLDTTWEEEMGDIGPRCPDCGGPMVRKTRKRDGKPFLSCQAFPRCRGTREVDDAGGLWAADPNDPFAEEA